MSKFCFFYISLTQDVFVFRSIIQFMDRRFVDVVKIAIIDDLFFERDSRSNASNELIELAQTYNLYLIPSWFNLDQLVAEVDGGIGDAIPILFSSESSVAPHAKTYKIARSVRSPLFPILLQHGYECLGFRHSQRQTELFGQSVEFGSKLVLGWGSIDSQPDATASTAQKYFPVGFTNNVFERLNVTNSNLKKKYVVVFETLHGERIDRQSPEIRNNFFDFVANLRLWCEQSGLICVLKPHPASRLKLPTGIVDNLWHMPVHKMPFDEIALAVSTPSTTVIDCISLNIPVVLWNNGEKTIEKNYPGIRCFDNFGEFQKIFPDARALSDDFSGSMLQDILDLSPEQVLENLVFVFKNLFERQCSVFASYNVIVSNKLDATQSICFFDRETFHGKLLRFYHFDEKHVTRFEELGRDNPRLGNLFFHGIKKLLNIQNIIFSRQPDTFLVDIDAQNVVPRIFHLDDNLFEVPIDVGRSKYEFYNNSNQLEILRATAASADRVIVSTDRLGVECEKILGRAVERMGVYGVAELSVRSTLFTERRFDLSPTILFAGTDHSHDLESCFVALEYVLKNNARLNFINIGGTKLPGSLIRCPNAKSLNIRLDYKIYRNLLQMLPCHIGLAPLSNIEFNICKADTKWVEYTSIGAITITDRFEVYEYPAIHDACVCVDGSVDSWISALETFSTNFEKWVEVRNRSIDLIRARHMIDDFDTVLRT